jgi:hypothetical protein
MAQGREPIVPQVSPVRGLPVEARNWTTSEVPTLVPLVPGNLASHLLPKPS